MPATLAQFVVRTSMGAVVAWALLAPLVLSAPRQFDDPIEAQWVTQRRTPHPAGCFTEPVYLAQPLEDYPFSRTYIKATVKVDGEPAAEAFERAGGHARSSAAWHYHEIATNHMVASNRPQELAELLLGVG